MCFPHLYFTPYQLTWYVTSEYHFQGTTFCILFFFHFYSKTQNTKSADTEPLTGTDCLLYSLGMNIYVLFAGNLLTVFGSVGLFSWSITRKPFFFHIMALELFGIDPSLIKTQILVDKNRATNGYSSLNRQVGLCWDSSPF